MATGVARDLDDEDARRHPQQERLHAGRRRVDVARQEEELGHRRLGRRDAGRGSVEDILRLQNSSTHYFQRPDATHVEVDPTATSLGGWAGRINLAKQNGNLLVLANIGAISPGFDPNDIGFQHGGVGRRQPAVPAGLSVDEAGQGVPLRARPRRVVPELRLRAATRTGTAGSSSSRGSSGTSGCSTSMFAYNPDTMSART